MAGIFIPNTEPICSECFWSYGYKLKCHCSDKNVLRDKGDRPVDCPIIHVPNHGRLTDADALKEKFNSICDRYDAGIINALDCVNQLLSAFNEAPTIIPATKKYEEDKK